MKFEQKIERFVLRHQLLRADGKYLVALSGGADSVSLLLVLHGMRYRIEACHCNFHLRGEESDRDEQFCVKLCEQLGIPLHRIHFDTKSYAELHKESIEMAARHLRYRYFEQLRKDVEADGICVAHHQDDSVETVLINLIRGTGLNGLKGISPRNGYILRPLLCVERKNILQYLEKHQQAFVTDSSNLVDDVVRNKIRLNIIPMFKEINPAVCDNIASTAAHVAEAQKMLDGWMGDLPMSSNGMNALPVGWKKSGNVLQLDKAQILLQPSPEYVLFAKLSPFGFTGSVIEEILAAINTVGKTWQSPTHQLLIDRNAILLREKVDQEYRPVRISEVGCYVVRPEGLDASDASSSESKLRVSVLERTVDFMPSKEAMTATLDAAKVAFPLTLRRTEKGDRFHPFGMKGSKLVSDYLTDRKKNLFEKAEQRVLSDAQGEIVWLVGERTSEKCRITADTTHILCIKLE